MRGLRQNEMRAFGVPITATLLAAMAAPGFGQAPHLHDSGAAPVVGFASADGAFVQAVAQGSEPGVEKLLDAELMWIDVHGKAVSKSQVLREIPKPLISANARGSETMSFAYGVLGNIQESMGRAHVLRVWVKRPDGWKLIVYQEVMSRDTPAAFTPGAGKECENPCKAIPFAPKGETERQVAVAYSKLETAAHARNSAAFGPMVADEFVAVSSNSDKVQTKRSRMEEFDRSKDGGLAPTPLLSARMVVFGDVVLMLSEHKPDRGDRLHVTRVWVKREGSWMETLSYQTSIMAPAP